MAASGRQEGKRSVMVADVIVRKKEDDRCVDDEPANFG